MAYLDQILLPRVYTALVALKADPQLVADVFDQLPEGTQLLSANLPTPDAPVPVAEAVESADQWQAEVDAAAAALAAAEAKAHKDKP